RLSPEPTPGPPPPVSGGRSRDDREAWQEHLEANGVVRADTADKPLTQSPIADEPYASVLVFEIPTTSNWNSSLPPVTSTSRRRTARGGATSKRLHVLRVALETAHPAIRAYSGP